MRLRIAVQSRPLALILLLVAALLITTACTVYSERPARKISDATGGEELEQLFWKEIKDAKWVELDRVLATNYSGMTPDGPLDRAATLDQYRTWKLKDYSLGDLKTKLNGSTFVVTYTISLNGTADSQPLPSTPQHMMTVWQQQKSGWMVIAHSVSQQSGQPPTPN